MATFAEQYEVELRKPMDADQFAHLRALGMTGEPIPIVSSKGVNGSRQQKRQRLDAAIFLIDYYNHFIKVPRHVNIWFSVEPSIIGAAIMGEYRSSWWDAYKRTTDFDCNSGKRAAFLFVNQGKFKIGLGRDLTVSKFIGTDADRAEAAIRLIYPEISHAP